MKKKFKSVGNAFAYLVGKAWSDGIPKRQLAIKSDMLPQQISNSLRRGDAKLDTLKKISKPLGYKVQICLTKKDF